MEARHTIFSARCMYELRFASLFDSGRAIALPCDERGCVDLDTISERMRISYFSARARMGRDFAYPFVQPLREGPDSAELAAAGSRRSRGAY